MEDVGRLPEAARLTTSTSEPASIPTLDGWIESLMTCKQLAEVDVQRLCEKVRGCPQHISYQYWRLVGQLWRVQWLEQHILMNISTGTRGSARGVECSTRGKFICNKTCAYAI